MPAGCTWKLLLHLLAILVHNLLLHSRSLKGLHHLSMFLLETLHLLEEGMSVIL